MRREEAGHTPEGSRFEQRNRHRPSEPPDDYVRIAASQLGVEREAVHAALILDLASPLATLDRVGGKGASLARLAAAGLPVPPGFHLTTHSYRRFTDENHLAESILAAAEQANADDPTSCENVSAQIRSLSENHAVPPDIAAQIRQWYSRLGMDNPPVAVRSSATAEDLPEISFAGQLETYLNVRGDADLMEAVKRCWASLWTSRAIAYRARQDIRPGDVSIAVVVQQMVPADVAGILFTANPLTGSRDQVMINAAWGLGEAIVGGSVTPDSFIVNKQTGAVEFQQIADKEMMTVLLNVGTRQESVPAEKRRKPSLEPQQAGELAKLGTRIEQLYGQPMDVEWAVWGERIFVLQARPITALPEPNVTFDWKLPRAKGRYARKLTWLR